MVVDPRSANLFLVVTCPQNERIFNTVFLCAWAQRNGIWGKDMTRSRFSSLTPQTPHLLVQNAKSLWKGIWGAWTGSGVPWPYLEQSLVGVGGGGSQWSKLRNRNRGLTFVSYEGSFQRRVTPQETVSIKLIDTLYSDHHYWDFNLRLICFFVFLDARLLVFWHEITSFFSISIFNFVISLFNNE